MNKQQFKKHMQEAYQYIEMYGDASCFALAGGYKYYEYGFNEDMIELYGDIFKPLAEDANCAWAYTILLDFPYANVNDFRLTMLMFFEQSVLQYGDYKEFGG